MVFLILAGLYVCFHLISHWVEYPLFRADTWFYFVRQPPWWFEIGYRFFLTCLPVAAWGYAILLILTRLTLLTHRRVALVVVFGGLMFFEADMRWFNLSKKHVSWTEIQVFFSLDHSADLGLRESDYERFYKNGAWHAGALVLCAFLAGPEPKAIFWALLDGPARKTLLGKLAMLLVGWGGAALRWTRANRALRLLDNRFALGLVVLAVLADPVIIWALGNQEELQESRSVVREVAETNPLRIHTLDRLWASIVHHFSEESQDLQAAQEALAATDATLPKVSDGRLHLSNRANKKPDNVLLIQIESVNAAVFAETDLPTIKEFSKKCLNLKRHFSTGNCTHYGILGFMHGSPVTFFNGPADPPKPCAYLDAFKDNGYKTRIITRSVLGHHSLGHYLNWTEDTTEIASDWHAAKLSQEQFAKPGSHLVYLFYHHTHYPYWHEEKKDDKRFDEKFIYQPEVDYEFDYNRSDLILYKDQIINRYKNALREFDYWLKDVFEKVDWDRTIVVVTGDHGEELFEQGRLGHCSSFTAQQTMPPCLIYIPGVEPSDVEFTTSHADVMPTIADALGWQSKPDRLGRSLFEPVPLRYAILANFEYKRPERWAVVTDDRKTLVDVTGLPDKLGIASLIDWQGRRLSYRHEPAAWSDNFKIVRQLQLDLKRCFPD